MNNIINSFKNYIYHSVITLETDGYIGIPVDIAVLYDNAFGKIKEGANGTPIILYVINANIERIGMEADETIISSMLSRGYAVVLLDYKKNQLAVSPALDYSVQSIRRRIIEQKENDELFVFGDGKFIETFVVPAGYDVELSNPYWAFDKHGADGILEKITEIWNNDFKGTNAEKYVKWTDNLGNRKKTEVAKDGSLPYWCNENGDPCENGEYIKLKYTYAEDITDCVKKNGEAIDLNLYMHLIYPKSPKAPVPVMCLSSSAEHLATGSSAQDRPHLNGFLFRGYAGVMFDYGYTPMARVDHYGYFDGYPRPGYVTGDNATYSMSFYNDKRIFSAAMRYIRYLTLSDERFSFDINAIGVYGNSKGSWMTFLGEENPEKLTSKRILAGHHDETRYEAGKTETIGIIRGGEKQPWLKYKEINIKSRAELVYSSTGGLDDSITAGHCPVFISSNRRDSSCYSTSNAIYAACLEHEVPAMNVDVDLPHTIVYGKDLVFGIDTYQAFFDFCGYYLKADAVKVVGVKANLDTLPYSLIIRFSGSVEEDEVKKITLISELGDTILGKWKGRCRGVDWVFIPDALDYSTKYTLNIPAELFGDNGKPIEKEFKFEFTSPKTLRISLSAQKNKANALSIMLLKNIPLGRSFIEFDVTNDGYNRIALCDTNGKEYAFVNTNGSGRYRIDISDIKDTLPSALVLAESRKSGYNTVYCSNFDSVDDFSFGKRAKCSLSEAPDGTPSIKIDGFETVKDHPTEEFYIYPDVAVSTESIVSKEPITKADMGRSFTVSLKIYDTHSRYVKIGLSHATLMKNSIIDCNRLIHNVITKPGEWINVDLDYTVYEIMYSDYESVKKSLSLSCYGTGDIEAPLYLGEIKTTEKLTSVEIGSVCLVTEEEPKDALPEGKSDIICHKSPWQK